MKAEISSCDDERLVYLTQFGDMALQMAGPCGKRVKQLTKDTATSIHHTCYGLVSLCKHLLTTSHSYVLLGKFTTDHLEKEFSKIRQGSGGTYFVSVQQAIEKLNIKHSSLLLKLKVNDDLESVSGHQCEQCHYELCEYGAETFDNLEVLEASVSDETKMSLVYVSGYVSRNDVEVDEETLIDHTFFYHQKYGSYLFSLDRGGLKIPTDHCCQWAIFCFIMFHSVKDNVCRTSLCRVFMHVSEFFHSTWRKNTRGFLQIFF